MATREAQIPPAPTATRKSALASVAAAASLLSLVHSLPADAMPYSWAKQILYQAGYAREKPYERKFQKNQTAALEYAMRERGWNTLSYQVSLRPKNNPADGNYLLIFRNVVATKANGSIVHVNSSNTVYDMVNSELLSSTYSLPTSNGRTITPMLQKTFSLSGKYCISAWIPKGALPAHFETHTKALGYGIDRGYIQISIRALAQMLGNDQRNRSAVRYMEDAKSPNFGFNGLGQVGGVMECPIATQATVPAPGAHAAAHPIPPAGIMEKPSRTIRLPTGSHPIRAASLPGANTLPTPPALSPAAVSAVQQHPFTIPPGFNKDLTYKLNNAIKRLARQPGPGR